MSDYKFSKFNYYQKSYFSDNFLVYNSLQRKIIRIPKEDAIGIGLSEKIAQDANVKYVYANENLEKKLLNQRIIVPESYNEDLEAHFKYLEEISTPGLGLTIIPTYRCNFRCPYCYQDHENGLIMSEETQNAIIKFVRKHIGNYAFVEISWFGGEPLLCLDIILKINSAVKQICKNRYKTFRSSITTNGYYLTKEVFEKLLDCGVRRYFITIDGLETEHDQQRYLINKAGTFSTIMKNLLDIKTLHHNRHFSINIRSNISRSNIVQLDSYIEYMHQCFSDDSRFAFFFRPVYDWGGDSIDGFREKLLQEKADREIFDKLLQSQYRLNYLEFYLDLTGSAVCYASKLNYFVINPEGSLNKCTCADRNNNNLVGYLLPTGDMQLNRSLLGQWSTQYTDSTKCENCYMQGLCLKSYCVSANVMKNQHIGNCFIAKNICDKVLMLLDKCDEDYGYIIDID